MALKQIGTRVNEETEAWLRQVAKARGMDLSALVREILADEHKAALRQKTA